MLIYNDSAGRKYGPTLAIFSMELRSEYKSIVFGDNHHNLGFVIDQKYKIFLILQLLQITIKNQSTKFCMGKDGRRVIFRGRNGSYLLCEQYENFQTWRIFLTPAKL